MHNKYAKNLFYMSNTLPLNCIKMQFLSVISICQISFVALFIVLQLALWFLL